MADVLSPAMNLKPRFLLFTAVLVLASAAAAWFASRQLAEGIVEQWAGRYAEKQVLYDKARILQPILREIALSRQLANAHEIRDWARHPDDPELTRLAIVEMENYRANFADRSYFVTLLKSGRYYHNNAADEFAGKQYRYTLSPRKPADRWFYDIVRQNRDMHINVNPDVNLGVTKLWIDVLIRDGKDILGVAGTGLDLSTFIQSVVDQSQPGITSMFVDHNGAIQAYRDQSFIDFASITKGAKEHKTLALLFDQAEDRAAIHAAMKELERMDTRVISRFVEIDGKRYLAGLAYLPEIDWYEITLLDLDVLLPISSFSGMLLAFGITLLLTLVLFNIVLGRLVLRPLAGIEETMHKVESGQDLPDLPTRPESDEIDRLMRHFLRMAHGMREARQNLEGKVRERTEALDRLTKVDSLSELLNRRGMTERIEAEISRVGREKTCFGLLWLDIDDFKAINDRFGHAKGDETLKSVAALIHSMIRIYDSASRWGGDEFLILVHGCDEAVVTGLGERIRIAVAQQLRLENDGVAMPVTASVGGYLAGPGEDMESLLHKADQALYAAKADGRNCFRLWANSRSLPVPESGP